MTDPVERSGRISACILCVGRLHNTKWHQVRLNKRLCPALVCDHGTRTRKIDIAANGHPAHPPHWTVQS